MALFSGAWCSGLDAFWVPFSYQDREQLEILHGLISSHKLVELSNYSSTRVHVVQYILDCIKSDTVVVEKPQNALMIFCSTFLKIAIIHSDPHSCKKGKTRKSPAVIAASKNCERGEIKFVSLVLFPTYEDGYSKGNL